MVALVLVQDRPRDPDHLIRKSDYDLVLMCAGEQLTQPLVKGWSLFVSEAHYCSSPLNEEASQV
jgi:hypothetical protein